MDIAKDDSVEFTKETVAESRISTFSLNGSYLGLNQNSLAGKGYLWTRQHLLKFCLKTGANSQGSATFGNHPKREKSISTQCLSCHKLHEDSFTPDFWELLRHFVTISS